MWSAMLVVFENMSVFIQIAQFYVVFQIHNLGILIKYIVPQVRQHKNVAEEGAKFNFLASKRAHSKPCKDFLFMFLSYEIRQ